MRYRNIEAHVVDPEDSEDEFPEFEERDDNDRACYIIGEPGQPLSIRCENRTHRTALEAKFIVDGFAVQTSVLLPGGSHHSLHTSQSCGVCEVACSHHKFSTTIAKDGKMGLIRLEFFEAKAKIVDPDTIEERLDVNIVFQPDESAKEMGRRYFLVEIGELNPDEFLYAVERLNSKPYAVFNFRYGTKASLIANQILPAPQRTRVTRSICRDTKRRNTYPATIENRNSSDTTHAGPSQTTRSPGWQRLIQPTPNQGGSKRQRPDSFPPPQAPKRLRINSKYRPTDKESDTKLEDVAVAGPSSVTRVISGTRGTSSSSDVEAPLRATFLLDNNIPDGQVFSPGTEFVKSWKMLNDGTRDWPESTELTFVSGNMLGMKLADRVVHVGTVGVGEKIDVWTCKMKAPKVPGQYVSCWQLNDGRGSHFGQIIWAEINVAKPRKADSSDEGSLAASSTVGPKPTTERLQSSVPSNNPTTEDRAVDIANNLLPVPSGSKPSTHRVDNSDRKYLDPPSPPPDRRNADLAIARSEVIEISDDDDAGMTKKDTIKQESGIKQEFPTQSIKMEPAETGVQPEVVEIFDEVHQDEKQDPILVFLNGFRKALGGYAEHFYKAGIRTHLDLDILAGLEEEDRDVMLRGIKDEDPLAFFMVKQALKLRKEAMAHA